MEPKTGIVYLIDTDTGKLIHTAFEVILHEAVIKRLERFYSEWYGKRLFAEVYSGSQDIAA